MGIWVEEEQTGYKKALRNSEHKAALISRTTVKQEKEKKKRPDFFFNPNFNSEVKTDIGRQLLRLIDKNFPSNDPISEIINRKTVKHGQSDIIT